MDLDIGEDVEDEGLLCPLGSFRYARTFSVAARVEAMEMAAAKLRGPDESDSDVSLTFDDLNDIVNVDRSRSRKKLKSAVRTLPTRILLASSQNNGPRPIETLCSLPTLEDQQSSVVWMKDCAKSRKSARLLRTKAVLEKSIRQKPFRIKAQNKNERFESLAFHRDHNDLPFNQTTLLKEKDFQHYYAIL